MAAKKSSARTKKSAAKAATSAKKSTAKAVTPAKKPTAKAAARVGAARARLPAKPLAKARRTRGKRPRADKGALEKQFVALALDLGLARAGEILAKLRVRLAKIGV